MYRHKRKSQKRLGRRWLDRVVHFPKHPKQQHKEEVKQEEQGKTSKKFKVCFSLITVVTVHGSTTRQDLWEREQLRWLSKLRWKYHIDESRVGLCERQGSCYLWQNPMLRTPCPRCCGPLRLDIIEMTAEKHDFRSEGQDQAQRKPQVFSLNPVDFLQQGLKQMVHACTTSSVAELNRVMVVARWCETMISS